MKDLPVLLAHLLNTVAKLLRPGGTRTVVAASLLMKQQLLLFWNAVDLEKELTEFRAYYNKRRVHSSLGRHTPAEVSGDSATSRADLANFRWQPHCCGLHQLPVAACLGIRHGQDRSGTGA